jgi:hypothetical protein
MSGEFRKMAEGLVEVRAEGDNLDDEPNTDSELQIEK